MWYHFQFESGCNPYIAMTENRKNAVLRHYRKRGVAVERIKRGFYLVHDKNL